MPKAKTISIFTLAFIALIALTLIGLRIYLPYGLTKYVNHQIAMLKGYGGSVGDIDVHLWRGAYQVHGFNIHKDKNGIKEPFVSADVIDLSIEWRALFHGVFVVEIGIDDIDLNFSKNQTGKEANWTEFIDSLTPFDINRLDVRGGKVAYIDHTAKPNVNVYIKDISMSVTNLQNVEDKNAALPSELNISGTSIGEGLFKVDGRMNILKDVPDADMNIKLENAALSAFNDYTREAAAIDFVSGKISLYSELAAANGKIKGYLKPVLTDVAVVSVTTQDRNIINVIWETAVAIFMQLFKNQPNDQFAMSIPIEGDLKNPDKDMWSAFISIFQNAFGRAFQRDTDGKIDFKDALKESDKQSTK